MAVSVSLTPSVVSVVTDKIGLSKVLRESRQCQRWHRDDAGHRYRHQKERRHLAELAEAERGSYLFQDMQARSKPFSFSASLQIIALSSVAGPLVGNELLSFKPGIVFRTKADCAIVYTDFRS
jgi:hypothetical protein